MKIINSDVDLTPAGNNIFEKGNIKSLGKKVTEQFRTSLYRGIFVAKRERPDIHQTVVVLSKRVKEPNENDWKELVIMIKYFNQTNKNYLSLSADSLKVVKWYVEASFAVHPGFKSHIGAITTMVQGAMQSVYRKHKIDTRINIEA